MQYLCLIYDDENRMRTMSEEARNQIMGAYWKFTEDVKTAGVLVAGEALQPTASATSVRVRGGKAATTDGPFAETKEQLGGFYLLDCKDLDEATKWAAQIPTAAHGTIEVRPVMVFEQ